MGYDTLPYFCNIVFGGNTGSTGGPPSGVTGGSTNTTSTGGPPSGVGGTTTGTTGASSNSTGASTGASTGGFNYLEIPRTGLIETCYRPNAAVEFTILGIMILIFIPSIILYTKNRKHLLIKYRQPTIVLIAGYVNAIMCILVPIYRYFGVTCYVNTWTINLLVFSSCIITYSRYVRGYYIHRLSIFKLRFGEKKNSLQKEKDKDKEKSITVKTDTVKSKEVSMSQQWEATTLKTSTFTKGSSFTNNVSMDSFGITDPTLYFKRLNQIINRKLVLVLVVVPLIFIVIYSIYITANNDSMSKPCANEARAVGTPKLILSIGVCLSSIFFFYQAYVKQRWDIEIKIEYTLYVVFLFICNLIMQLTVKGVLPDGFVRYRMYIFHFYTVILHIITMVVPLVKIYMSELEEKDDKLTEEEFLSKLSNATFKAQVREIATNTFCIENLLFFEAHCDLMNMVISYYVKRNTIVPSGEVVSYSSSDVLNRNTLSPILYKNFDNVFKPQFEQVYNLYIKEDGIAAINIKSTTIKTIEEQMENDNYSYLMFSQAAEEVGELLYSNIYPRMKEA